MVFNDFFSQLDSIDGLRRAILIIAILIGTTIVARIFNHMLFKWNERATKNLKVDVTHFTFMRHFITGSTYTIGFGIAIFLIPELRALSVSILAGAGVLAVIIGFASQAAFSNVVSGVFIAIFKPFRVGDRVQVGVDIYGVVEDIDLRQTTIRNFQNKRIIIPNSVINESIIENSTKIDEKVAKWVEFGISFDSSVDKAMAIMREEAEKNPRCLDNRSPEEKRKGVPKVIVRLIGFGDSSVNLRAVVWAKNPGDAWVMGTELNKSIKERFDKEGIEMPYPYRTVIIKDAKSLAGKLK